MFNHKKENLTTESSNVPAKQTGEEIKVHSMPDKFLGGKTNSVAGKETTLRGPGSSGGVKKNIVWGVLAVVVLGGLMVLAAWLFLRSIDKKPQTIEVVTQGTGQAVADVPKDLTEEKNLSEREELLGSIVEKETGPELGVTNQVYRNDKYGYEIEYPVNWQIDNENTSENELVFVLNQNDLASREAIRVDISKESVDDWFMGMDADIVVSTSTVVIDRVNALRVDTKESGLVRIAFVKGNKFYLIESTGGILKSGVLDSFRFINTVESEEVGDLNEEELLETQSKEKPTSSVDTDSDGLTDVEESLYSTDVIKPDTDQDGYLDGDELINFYSPIKSGDKLEGSGLVKKYANAKFGYTILRPTAWSEEELDESRETVMFTSETTEFVEVIVQENLSGINNIRTWYLAQVQGIEPSNVANLKIGNLVGVVSPDGMNVYIMKDNLIYTISYNINLKEEANYFRTFEMMVNSFKLFESPTE